MSQVRASAADGRLHVIRGIHGAQSEVRITNETRDRIDSTDIQITVETPKEIFVEIGQAIEQESGVFEPALDIRPESTIHLPLFIERGIGHEFDEEQIQISVQINGNESEAEITILG